MALEKVLSNLQEVRARGGELFLFADREVDTHLSGVSTHVLSLGAVPGIHRAHRLHRSLQLLAYHVAVLKGTDVDQPRNWPSRSRSNNVNVFSSPAHYHRNHT
jgi:glucosamine--fructose-6-phosphate aminotransferase (isomerizing)